MAARPIRPQIATARDAVDVVEPHFRACTAERLAVLHLDADARLLAMTFAPGGALPLRAIFADALRLGAAALVLAHNGDCGLDPIPTRRFAAAADALGIALHDHLIFTAGEWRSLRGAGLI